jgi:hypothetical protein
MINQRESKVNQGSKTRGPGHNAFDSGALPNITCDEFHSRKWSKLASNKMKRTFVKSPMPAFAQ